MPHHRQETVQSSCVALQDLTSSGRQPCHSVRQRWLSAVAKTVPSRAFAALTEQLTWHAQTWQMRGAVATPPRDRGVLSPYTAWPLRLARMGKATATLFMNAPRPRQIRCGMPVPTAGRHALKRQILAHRHTSTAAWAAVMARALPATRSRMHALSARSGPFCSTYMPAQESQVPIPPATAGKSTRPQKRAPAQPPPPSRPP